MSFGDVPTTAWYHPYVTKLAVEGIISGIGSGQFAPDNDLTRAEISKIIWKLRNRQAQQSANPYEWPVTPCNLKFRTSTDTYFDPTGYTLLSVRQEEAPVKKGLFHRGK